MQDVPSSGFIDLLLLFFKDKKSILRITIFFLFLGMIHILFAPKLFLSSANILPDLERTNSMYSGSIAALSRSLGFQLGSGIEGISGDIYPNIISSKEVLAPLLKEHFYIKTTNEKVILEDYLTSTHSFWGRTKDFLISLLKGNEEFIRQDSFNVTPEEIEILSKKELEAIKKINSDMLFINLEQSTGIVTISILSEDPALSVQLLSRIIYFFKKQVNNYFTAKALENNLFIKERYTKIRDDLLAVEDDLAEFASQNSDLATPLLSIKYDRLKRQVTFAEDLFNNIQLELAKSDLELNRTAHILITLEKPNYSIDPFSPKKKILLILYFLIGLTVALVYTIVKNYVHMQKTLPEINKKYLELESNLNFLKKFGFRKHNRA